MPQNYLITFGNNNAIQSSFSGSSCKQKETTVFMEHVNNYTYICVYMNSHTQTHTHAEAVMFCVLFYELRGSAHQSATVIPSCTSMVDIFSNDLQEYLHNT